MLHTMLRVANMKRSVDFYTRVMGMRILRIFEQPTDQYSLTFLGYGEEANTYVLELTYNYGVAECDMGNAYGHIAIGVENCEQACTDIKERGGKVILEASPLKGSHEVIAFVEDPDGYPIELIERPDKWQGCNARARATRQ
jgi:lactoylglutathione lyase